MESASFTYTVHQSGLCRSHEIRADYQSQRPHQCSHQRCKYCGLQQSLCHLVSCTPKKRLRNRDYHEMNIYKIETNSLIYPNPTAAASLSPIGRSTSRETPIPASYPTTIYSSLDAFLQTTNLILVWDHRLL